MLPQPSAGRVHMARRDYPESRPLHQSTTLGKHWSRLSRLRLEPRGSVRSQCRCHSLPCKHLRSLVLLRLPSVPSMEGIVSIRLRCVESGMCIAYLLACDAALAGVPTFFATDCAALSVACAPRSIPLAAALTPRSTPLAATFAPCSAAFTPRSTPLAAAFAPRTTAFSTFSKTPGSAAAVERDGVAVWAATLLTSTSKSDSNNAI